MIDDILMHNSFIRPKNLLAAKKHCQKKQIQFQALVNKEKLDQTHDFDSDDDQSNFDFSIGQKIDYYNRNMQKWVSAEICKITGELVQIKLENKKNTIFQWINKDSENIMLENQMINNEEKEYDSYNEENNSSQSSYDD
eukprot:TRINITY_DN1900_c0_g1_i2.p2 TRINITY_DN1900_c0_g1~~TRINITY_DN1900_c0_g1_i2.p2  ORF type:complete len:139 (+),score=39.48 TRINITY_DN1900_c0_g1_i2:435-851(+)